MWACLYVLAINFLVYESLAAPQYIEHVQVERDLNDTYDGYRCGRRVLRREYLEEETRHAASTFGLYTLVPEFDFDPQTYAGRLNFGTRTAYPIMWQLLQDENASVQTIVEYFVILDVINDGVLRIAGVLRRRNGNDLKCIREKDLSEVSGHEFATGYRCPLDIYSFYMIEDVMGFLLEHEEVGQRKMNVERVILNDIDGQPLFEGSEGLTSRKITTEGKLHNTAVGALIIDEFFQFVGMVYKKENIYIRCKLTVHDQIQPKFIGPALSQETKSMDVEDIDVFWCDPHFLSSNEILRIAKAAPEVFRKRTKSSRTVFPRPFISYSDGVKGFYQWPIRKYLRNKIYHIPESSTFTGLRYYALIDEFSDVYNVITVTESETFYPCPRGLVKKEIYFDDLKSELFKTKSND